MTNLTLKIAGLLIISLFSAQTFANSPWADSADETPTNETFAEDAQNEPPVEPIFTQTEAPAAESIDADIPVEPVAIETQPIPTTVTQSAIQNTTQNTTQGDVLNNVSQNSNIHVLNFPRRGMTTDKVQNELGQPSEIIPSVGEPPISRWVYDDRTVYFEYSSVIHVVAK